MAHWQDFNPWTATLVYPASLEEWLCCLEFPESRWVYRNFIRQRRFVDCYILPDRTGKNQHSIGLRYGPEGADYLSPPCNCAIAGEIIAKYQPILAGLESPTQ